MQKIQYAKGKSDTIAKLDGTYKMPVAGGAEHGVQGTDLQKEVFGGLPGSSVSAPPGGPAAAAAKSDGEKEPKGVKRGREEDEEEEGSDEDAPMEQDSDDAPMEEDSDDEEE